MSAVSVSLMMFVAYPRPGTYYVIMRIHGTGPNMLNKRSQNQSKVLERTEIVCAEPAPESEFEKPRCDRKPKVATLQPDTIANIQPMLMQMPILSSTPPATQYQIPYRASLPFASAQGQCYSGSIDNNQYADGINAADSNHLELSNIVDVSFPVLSTNN
ncbi:hypothetical protein M409DRAFT_60229 [Zasmidium cellare ATCC 36951]|uniref:Uncharacterized protein n=1 Tax=Zasmidium cellare ATCC 36951 TaxID=1080233 RepID=A0A6A6C2Z6_ZASCE|nr:uncharacterized protein M409DRAFT_60229 [Zasmidium cellare ATCC 36951]KAF2160119.1 hypothetical protein M409DRAFT_60229 [Zasmidium cellare ATCC 36951]